MRRIQVAVVVLLIVGAVHARDAKTATLSDDEAKDGFVSLFDGKTLQGWQGDVKGYAVDNGTIVCKGDNLYTDSIVALMRASCGV